MGPQASIDPFQRDLAERRRRRFEHQGASAPEAPTYEELTRYQRIRFSVNVTQFDQQQTFEASGNHLTVLECCGAFRFHVKLGDFASNPWIPVREGMVIKREFSRVRVAIFSHNGGFFGATNDFEKGYLVMYASHGELFELPPKEYGIRNPVFINDTATTTWKAVSPGAPSINGSSPFVGKYGGSVIITNTDLANTLLIAYRGDIQVAPDFFPPTKFYHLLPGASISLQLETRMGGFNPVYPVGIFPTLSVATAVGTCTFDAILGSSEHDASDDTELLTYPPPTLA